MSIIKALSDYIVKKQEQNGWTCHCEECLWVEFMKLTDDEILEIVRNLS